MSLASQKSIAASSDRGEARRSGTHFGAGAAFASLTETPILPVAGPSRLRDPLQASKNGRLMPFLPQAYNPAAWVRYTGPGCVAGSYAKPYRPIPFGV